MIRKEDPAQTQNKKLNPDLTQPSEPARPFLFLGPAAPSSLTRLLPVRPAPARLEPRSLSPLPRGPVSPLAPTPTRLRSDHSRPSPTSSAPSPSRRLISRERRCASASWARRSAPPFPPSLLPPRAEILCSAPTALLGRPRHASPRRGPFRPSPTAESPPAGPPSPHLVRASRIPISPALISDRERTQSSAQRPRLDLLPDPHAEAGLPFLNVP